MKGVYMALYDSVNEMAREAEKSQGRDTLNYVRRAVWKINKYLFARALTWPSISLSDD